MLGLVLLLLGLTLVAGGVFLIWRRREVMLQWATLRSSNRAPFFPDGLIAYATGLAMVVVIAGIVLLARGL